MNKESSIDRKYREKVFNYYLVQPILQGTRATPKWVAPCPFCSGLRNTESKRNEKVCALIWVNNWNTWVFTCRRTACRYGNLSFPRFIQALNPELYLEYQRERYHSGSTGYQTNCPNPCDPMVPLPRHPQGKPSRSKNTRSTGSARSTGSNRPPGARRQPPGQQPKDQPQQGN